jgi:hypothetical protein
MKEKRFYKTKWSRGYFNSNGQIGYWEYKSEIIPYKIYYIK